MNTIKKTDDSLSSRGASRGMGDVCLHDETAFCFYAVAQAPHDERISVWYGMEQKCSIVKMCRIRNCISTKQNHKTRKTKLENERDQQSESHLKQLRMFINCIIISV